MRAETTARTSVALACGAVAGPLLVVVGLTQAFLREGFDLRHDTLGLLGNGDLGWIQVLNFINVLFVATALLSFLWASALAAHLRATASAAALSDPASA
jgi:hypothetical protein